VPERDVLLGGVAQLVRGVSYHPADLLTDRQDAIPLLRATNIGNHVLEFTDVLHVPSALVREFQFLRRFDVVIAMSSGSRLAVGRLAQLRQDWGGCVGAFCGVIRPDPESVDPEYLGYVLQSSEFRTRIETFAVGTAIMNLSRERLLGFPLRLPELAEQRAIAHILGMLDDKIELNRRMNETLEAMARALFKSWFVDFDPVHAKAEGRDTGLPADIAALFPDSFEDSDLGPIPQGWTVSGIGSVTDVIDCLHSKKPDRSETGLPLLQLVNIRDDGLIDMEDPYLVSEEDYRNWVSRVEASPGDCVITNVGRVGAVAQMPGGQKAALGRNMTALRCRYSFPFPTVLIECLLSQAMREEIVRNTDTGTILDALNVRNIPELSFVRPTPDNLALFETSVRPFREQMERHLAEARTLAALRDTLLPKLISGKLAMTDVDRQMESHE
jgi:type I restriction enzyme S subunit